MCASVKIFNGFGQEPSAVLEKALKSRFIGSTTNAAALVVLFLCAACAPSTPAPTEPVPTPLPYNTSVLPDVRPTLPPTWTWTPTPTASQTPLPSLTPTPEPTRSLNDLCASLHVDFPYAEGHVFEPDDTLLLVFGTLERTWQSEIQAQISGTATPRPPAILTEPVMVRFLVVHRETGENLGAQAVGGELMALELPINQLPLAGTYDWTVSIYIESLGEQCARTGSFVVAEATDEP